MECRAIEAFSEKPPTQRRDFMREIRCDSLIAGEFDNAVLGILKMTRQEEWNLNLEFFVLRDAFKVVNEGEKVRSELSC